MNYNINKLNNQVVAKGYKNTKVGVIPVDWEVVKIGKLTDIDTGKTPLRSNSIFWKDGTVHWATTTEVNDTYILSTNEKITQKAVEKLKMKIFPINTILMAMYGQGKTRGKVALLKIESTINQAFASIKPNKNYSTDYVFSYLNNSYIKIRNLSNGGSQDNLNLDIVKSIKIPLPPLKEQEKIANILTTWDDAISKQEELIKAKEELKKGLMQKLLSGEVRFDGFSDEWESKKLSILCQIKKGQQLNKSTLTDVGEYPAINGGINPSGYTNTYNTDKNTITISEGGNSCGYVNYITTKFWSGGHCYSLLNLKVNNYFLYQYLKLFELNIMRLRVGSGLPNIQKGDIENFKIKLPAKQEQQKIAQVLINADKEIDLLKNELEELKEQKKGLMQKLLTGKVRVKV